MTESDLRMIETELGITLPEEYRRVMLRSPFEQCGQNYPYLRYLADAWNAPQYVIEINLNFRKCGFYGVPLPSPYYFCFAEFCGYDYELDEQGITA